MGAISTEILADPASCRSGADYLAQLAAADEQAATALYRARSMSESGWSGEASDAFREYVDRTANGVDELVRVIHLTERALRSFADDIDTCRHRMQTARDTAAQAGLMITGQWIHKPVRATSLPEDPKTPALPGLNPTGAEEQEAAWDQASALVNWARELERTAHGDLSERLTETNAALDQLGSWLWWITSAAAFAGALHGAATMLQAEASQHLQFVENFKRWAADTPRLPAEVSQARLTQLMENYGIKQAQAASNARALGNLGNTKIGNAILTPLSKTLGDGREGMIARVGKATPLLGLFVATAQTGEQIAVEGEPVDKAIQTNFGGWGAGVAVGGGSGLILSGLGLAGGPATIAAVGIGTATTWTYHYLQDHTWEDLKHDVGQAANKAMEAYDRNNDILRKIEQDAPGSVPKI